MGKVDHEEREHADLSPSGTERWMHCPGSIKLSRGRRQTSGKAAIEGTIAHEWGESILREESELADIPDEDMRLAVTRYVEFISDLENGYEGDFEYLLEERIDLRHLGGDCWGTLDYASWQIGKSLHVIDYKNGLVLVEARNNRQLLTYALGICEDIGYDFEYIYLVIVQPRASHAMGPIRSWRIPPSSLKEYKKILKKAIKETQNEHANLESGAWCQYCPAIGNCPEIVGTAQELAKIEFDDPVAVEPSTALPAIEIITDSQLSLIIEYSRAFRAWIDGCQNEAILRLETGRDIPGLKLVRTPGRSRWKEPDSLPTEFTRVVPKTITECRKEFGQEVEEFVERPEGNIVAAPQEDGRVEYISAKQEFSDD